MCLGREIRLRNPSSIISPLYSIFTIFNLSKIRPRKQRGPFLVKSVKTQSSNNLWLGGRIEPFDAHWVRGWKDPLGEMDVIASEYPRVAARPRGKADFLPPHHLMVQESEWVRGGDEGETWLVCLPWLVRLSNNETDYSDVSLHFSEVTVPHRPLLDLESVASRRMLYTWIRELTSYTTA